MHRKVGWLTFLPVCPRLWYAAASRRGRGEKTTISWATFWTPSIRITSAPNTLRIGYAKLTGGRVEVQVYPSSQLGGEREMAEAIQFGDAGVRRGHGGRWPGRFVREF